MKEVKSMAMYMAIKIMDKQVTYNELFSFGLYKRYQNDVDAILIAEGSADLIGK